MKSHWVCSKAEIFQYVGVYGVTHVVSLLEDRSGVDKALALGIPRENIHHVSMKDTEDRFHSEAPTLEHVKGVFAFVDTLPEDAVLLVHCEGGISRSPAMWVAIDSYTSGNTDIRSLTKRLIEKRRVSYPNKLILDIASNILDDVYLPEILEDEHFGGLII